MTTTAFTFCLPALALLAQLITQGAHGVEIDVERANTDVANAEAAVKRATERHALWTSASDALVLAKKLLAADKLPAAAAQANLARELAELGIAQTEYPLFCEC